jgi:predicted nucleotidyltransferase
MARTFDYPGLRILNIFFEDPYREYHLREAASRAKVSPSTAKRFLQEYTRLQLIAETRKANLHLFKANLDQTSFRLWKTSFFLLRNMPLLQQLANQYPVSSLTLYGSCATGTDAPGSDLDLLLITRKDEDPPSRQLDILSSRTGRIVQLLRYTPEEWEKKAREDKPFYERVIIDGIAISGALPVVAT